MSDILLEAIDLTRCHPNGGDPLLDGVSLAIGRGERVALTGDSGSGKTLLLRALAMLDPVDAGRVLWQGDTITHDAMPEFRRQVAYFRQQAALIDATVEAALRRPFSLGVHRDRCFEPERILPWLKQLGRDPSFLEKPASELSGGEIQLVALLRTLQLDPIVVLLDEPTAALDATATAAVEQLLDDWFNVKPGQRSLVWVSHNARQADRVADRTIQMEAGRIV